MGPLPEATDAQIRELAAQILARDPYARWRPENANWLFETLRALQRWLDRFSNWMLDLSATRPYLYAALVGGLLLVAVLLLAHVVYALRAALASAPAPAGSGSPEPGFLDEADVLARAGRYLEAAHRVQLGVIALLLRRNVLELSRSDPNRTLRRRLQQAALPNAERGELLALLDRFETRWFRDRADDPDLYDAWCRLHARLHEGVRGVPEPA